MTKEEYGKIYGEVYNFSLRHTTAPETRDAWHDTALDALHTLDRCGNRIIAMELLIAAYNELSRECPAMVKKPDIDKLFNTFGNSGWND